MAKINDGLKLFTPKKDLGTPKNLPKNPALKKSQPSPQPPVLNIRKKYSSQ